jgi:O-antigen/teichoic acid export membrane protein
VIHKIIFNREFHLVALSQIVGLLSSIVFIKLVSHYTSVAEYGIYSLVLSIAAFVALFPFTPFDQAVSRYVSEYKDKGNFAENYTNIIFLYSILSILLIMGSLLFYPWIKTILPEELRNMYGIIIIFILTSILRTTLLNIENFDRKRKTVFYSRILEGVFRIVLIIFLINYFRLTASNILGIVSLIFFINIVGLLVLRHKEFVLKGLSFPLLKINFHNFYNFSSPLLIWAVFSWVQLYVVIWFLEYYTSTKEVGYFNLLNTIAIIIPTQVIGVIGTYIVPIMYQKEKSNKGYTKQKVKEITFYLAIFFSLITLFLFFFHNFVVGVLSSSKYVVYSWMLPYLFIASSLFNIALVWTYEFFVYKQTKRLLFPQIMPAVVSIFCCYFFIPRFGLESVIYILLFSSFLYLLLVSLQSFRTFAKSI